jgi:hypothetical protein
MNDGFTIRDDDDDAPGKTRRARARDLIPVILQSAELWCDRRGAACATIERGGHRESHPVAARGFRAWFTSVFFAETGGAVSGSALADGVRLAESCAMTGGAVHAAWRRWGMSAPQSAIAEGCVVETFGEAKRVRAPRQEGDAVTNKPGN